ncbi:hypothetical protein ACLKA6_002146 [Drosophila palustris]
MICDDAQIAEWNNQGLPSDRMSAENAAILVQSQRYPLMIDPQLQGINVSLGQGQEIIAEKAIETAAQQGHWVILQNIHLVARWLSSLEKKMEASLINVNPKYRLFLSAEPAELMGRVEDRNPYIIVAFQECERMNILMAELRRSLNELDLGLKGELTISSIMEDLMLCLYMDQVPEQWTKLAYPSLLGLQSWFGDLMLRLRFFNPQSLLTAIMQQTARKNEWPLDRMCLNCDVTKKFKEEFTSAPREGAYVNGLFMEGARWDMKMSTITDALNKELFPAMPVIYIKAVTQDKQETKNIYECPVYKIRLRGPTYVWTFNLKSKERDSKWTLAGVCLLLQT